MPGGTGFAAAYYLRILGGLYAVEAASALAAVLPRPAIARLVAGAFGPADGDGMGGPAKRTLLSPEGVAELRLDGLAIVALVAGGFWLYGPHWPMLAAALAGRAFLVSFLDNAYHYETPLDDRVYALNPALPRSLSALMLNFNLHGVHHAHPGVPWTGLPAAARQDRAPMADNLLVVALRQLKGPIEASRLPAAVRAA